MVNTYLRINVSSSIFLNINLKNFQKKVNFDLKIANPNQSINDEYLFTKDSEIGRLGFEDKLFQFHLVMYLSSNDSEIGRFSLFERDFQSMLSENLSRTFSVNSIFRLLPRIHKGASGDYALYLIVVTISSIKKTGTRIILYRLVY